MPRPAADGFFGRGLTQPAQRVDSTGSACYMLHGLRGRWSYSNRSRVCIITARFRSPVTFRCHRVCRARRTRRKLLLSTGANNVGDTWFCIEGDRCNRKATSLINILYTTVLREVIGTFYRFSAHSFWACCCFSTKTWIRGFRERSYPCT